MDAKTVEMLSKGLHAHKRKGTISDEPSKRTKVGTSSPATFVDVATASEAAIIAEVAPAAGVGSIAKVVGPSMPSSPPIEVPPLMEGRGWKIIRRRNQPP